jgi:hypothetical protein
MQPMQSPPSHPWPWGRIGAWALALSSVWGTAQATQFATFQLFGDQHSGDAYPGKIAFINHRNESICVNFQILNDQNQVLRDAKVGIRIPAMRSDLVMTGPGEKARLIRMAILVGNNTPCVSTWLGWKFSISPGDFHDTPSFKVKFDARTWNDKSRDILIEIKP